MAGETQDYSVFTQKYSRNESAGLYWAFCGDSITNGSAASNYAYSYGPKAASTLGALVSRFDIINAGKPGATSSDLLTRMPRILSAGAQALVIMIGTNDAGLGISAATFISNLTQILTLAAGATANKIPVVLCTVAARGSSAPAGTTNLLTAYNAWIRTFGPSFGCVVADTYAVTADPTSGYLLASMDSGDATHPNDTGHNAIAKVVMSAMIKAANYVTPNGIIRTGNSVGITNMVQDCLAATLGAGKPAGWFEQPGGTGTAPTYTVKADTSSVLPAGNWAEMDFDGTSSGGTRRLASNGLNSAYWSVGDTLLLTGHVQIEDTSGTWEADVIAGNSSFGIGVVNQSAVSVYGAPSRMIGRKNSSGYYDIGPLVLPFTVPMGTTGLNVWCSMVVPTGKHYKMRIGALGVINLTQLGIASYYNWSGSAGNVIIQ